MERYTFTNGWTMQREKEFPRYWILSDQNNTTIYRDQYRNDIIDRHDLRSKIKTHVGALG